VALYAEPMDLQLTTKTSHPLTHLVLLEVHFVVTLESNRPTPTNNLD